MANTPKILFRGAATTNVATVLYTTPSLTTTVITSVVIANTAASAGTYTIGLNGVALCPTITIPAYAIVTLDMRQVITAAQTITGGASSTSINFHISGMESN
jgi:hypothetical protein